MACQQEHRYHRHCPSCRPRRSQNHHLPLKKDPSPPPRTPHHAPPLRFLPQNITSLHAHTASKDATGFQRISRDVVGKRELRVLRRVSGGGLLHWWLSLPPPIRGKAAATPPVDAIQDRFSARTACQPSLQLSTVSSSSSMLCFSHSQGAFLQCIYQILSRCHPRRF